MEIGGRASELVTFKQTVNRDNDIRQWLLESWPVPTMAYRQSPFAMCARCGADQTKPWDERLTLSALHLGWENHHGQSSEHRRRPFLALTDHLLRPPGRSVMIPYGHTDKIEDMIRVGGYVGVTWSQWSGTCRESNNLKFGMLCLPPLLLRKPKQVRPRHSFRYTSACQGDVIIWPPCRKASIFEHGQIDLIGLCS